MLCILASVLFIFGPSCGGKSTLAKSLVQHLGPLWTYLDRDELIKEGLCAEEQANTTLQDMILFMESNNQHVVIDAHIPWRAPNTEYETYILVHAPLSTLLARDAKRTVQLHRPPKRAHYARLYVEETFAEVFKAPVRLNFCYDLVLDSSKCSLKDEIVEVLHLLSQ